MPDKGWQPPVERLSVTHRATFLPIGLTDAQIGDLTQDPKSL
jgi:hypothetical protein